MSTATVAMTPEQAREFRAGRDAASRMLTRMSTAALWREDSAALADHGTTRLYGKPSRDELIAEILDLRYPLGRLNEASHVLHHADEVWDGCPYCIGSAS